MANNDDGHFSFGTTRAPQRPATTPQTSTLPDRPPPKLSYFGAPTVGSAVSFGAAAPPAPQPAQSGSSQPPMTVFRFGRVAASAPPPPPGEIIPMFGFPGAAAPQRQQQQQQPLQQPPQANFGFALPQTQQPTPAHVASSGAATEAADATVAQNVPGRAEAAKHLRTFLLAVDAEDVSPGAALWALARDVLGDIYASQPHLELDKYVRRGAYEDRTESSSSGGDDDDEDDENEEAGSSGDSAAMDEDDDAAADDDRPDYSQFLVEDDIAPLDPLAAWRESLADYYYAKPWRAELPPAEVQVSEEFARFVVEQVTLALDDVLAELDDLEAALEDDPDELAAQVDALAVSIAEVAELAEQAHTLPDLTQTNRQALETVQGTLVMLRQRQADAVAELRATGGLAHWEADAERNAYLLDKLLDDAGHLLDIFRAEPAVLGVDAAAVRAACRPPGVGAQATPNPWENLPNATLEEHAALLEQQLEAFETTAASVDATAHAIRELLRRANDEADTRFAGGANDTVAAALRAEHQHRVRQALAPLAALWLQHGLELPDGSDVDPLGCLNDLDDLLRCGTCEANVPGAVLRALEAAYRSLALQAPDGAAALAEIASEQARTDLILDRAAFAAVVRDLIRKHTKSAYDAIEPEALEALQVAAEAHAIEVLAGGAIVAAQARSDEALHPADFRAYRAAANRQ